MDTPLPVIEAPATVVPPAAPPGPAAAVRHDERKATSETRSADETAATSGGQRRVNLIWEGTQGLLAAMLVGTACYCMMAQIPVRNEYWLLVGIVVQAYYQRTNHTARGGVGVQATDSR